MVCRCKATTVPDPHERDMHNPAHGPAILSTLLLGFPFPSLFRLFLSEGHQSYTKVVVESEVGQEAGQMTSFTSPRLTWG